MKIFLPILVLISTSGFAQRSYTIPKDDFIKQFSDTAKVSRIFCINKKGEKVWLHNASGFETTLTLKDSKKKVKFIGGRYQEGLIVGQKVNWKLALENISVDFDQVSLISIQSQARESPYYNIDSVKHLQIAKNDSLAEYYASGNQVVIYLVSKVETELDSLLIFENACYHISFKDNRQLNDGVVHKITMDSIFIFSTFNVNTAKKNHEEYKLLKYPIGDIMGLSLLKGGGYSFKDISVKDYNLVTVMQKKRRPTWFVLNPFTGKIRLYRLWLVQNGFFWIGEQDGNAIWLEEDPRTN